MLERQKPFEPVEMVFHEEMDLRDPIATGKHGQQAHGNDFGQIVHRSASGPRILDGFKYHQHAVHLGHHCSSLVTMHLGIRLERAWRLASCPPWVFALSRDEISNEKALGVCVNRITAQGFCLLSCMLSTIDTTPRSVYVTHCEKHRSDP